MRNDYNDPAFLKYLTAFAAAFIRSQREMLPILYNAFLVGTPPEELAQILKGAQADLTEQQKEDNRRADR